MRDNQGSSGGGQLDAHGCSVDVLKNKLSEQIKMLPHTGVPSLILPEYTQPVLGRSSITSLGVLLAH
jgi:hypothetical protein